MSDAVYLQHSSYNAGDSAMRVSGWYDLSRDSSELVIKVKVPCLADVYLLGLLLFPDWGIACFSLVPASLRCHSSINVSCTDSSENNVRGSPKMPSSLSAFASGARQCLRHLQPTRGRHCLTTPRPPNYEVSSQRRAWVRTVLLPHAAISLLLVRARCRSLFWLLSYMQRAT